MKLNFLLPKFKLYDFDDHRGSELARLIFKVANVPYDDINVNGNEQWDAIRYGSCVFCVYVKEKNVAYLRLTCLYSIGWLKLSLTRFANSYRSSFCLPFCLPYTNSIRLTKTALSEIPRSYHESCAGWPAKVLC